MLLAGVWLIAAPPLLDFEAAQRAFRPYWIPLTLAVVIMLAGCGAAGRALAPDSQRWPGGGSRRGGVRLSR
jgi:hypothetical protein